jgi:anti-anti-sigma factor
MAVTVELAEPLSHPTVRRPERGVTSRLIPTVQVVVALSGELDMSTRELAYDACMACASRHVIVDLGAVTFLDCSGLGAILAARVELERCGGSLTLRNAVGEPARLLLLVGE